MTRNEKARAAIYGMCSAALKIAGIHGIVTQDESQALLLIISGAFDLALLFVPGLRSSSDE